MVDWDKALKEIRDGEPVPLPGDLMQDLWAAQYAWVSQSFFHLAQLFVEDIKERQDAGR